MITVPQIHWIAGFLEGEGSFQWRVNARTNRPSRGGSLIMSATQVQREPLDRLAGILGGTVSAVKRSPRARCTEQDVHQWYLCGKIAAGAMMTLYSLMSPRRQTQIRTAFAGWHAAPGHDWRLRTVHHCKYGHPYTKTVTNHREGWTQRICSVCQRDRQQRLRARKRAQSEHQETAHS
jgi:hypothetical protein